MTCAAFEQVEIASSVPEEFARLDRLRIVTGKTWAQIAEDLKVDRSLFFHVKAGSRTLSPKLRFRLEQAEAAAGIVTAGAPVPGNAGRVIAALRAAGEAARVPLTAKDIDRGYVDVSLQYRRGRAPKGMSTSLRLSTPPMPSAVRALGLLRMKEDAAPLLRV